MQSKKFSKHKDISFKNFASIKIFYITTGYYHAIVVLAILFTHFQRI